MGTQRAVARWEKARRFIRPLRKHDRQRSEHQPFFRDFASKEDVAIEIETEFWDFYIDEVSKRNVQGNLLVF
ncbi:hypothetical protein CWC46_08550 [Prodigiosinella confusarubida]|uniref:Uncharacterized protein n=1 Tax=Serratia sp. (strain ATCC 39006) TaxID=104623 RepID=A0A2I5THY1_SERS3|nr:hypothetical protein CWC46_08550 [Serratia sp. ATCC 39006]AUH04172.1 hypothetical protein Ser39006_008555 [Serratia sp. ATCC 39006]